ncbi:MAG: sigma 54-interacting transcriptional regulator [Deltaproteobacteria bacterium]|nr:sigma 54-interacting transcriptional regulator [Deltaproteobacteria bacterium]
MTDQEIARRIREAFRSYPATDVAIEAICYNIQNPYEGYIIVDDQDRIVFLSEANEKFFSVSGEQAFLKPDKEVSPTSQLERVMRTGKAEVGEIAEYRGGQIRIVARFPVRRNDKVIGAYGKIVFANVDRLNRLVGEIDELRIRLKVAEEELSSLKDSRYSFRNIIGKSTGIRKALDMAQRVCKSDAFILLQGETGTGKELFAHGIHYQSLRKNGPFVRVNCAAISDELAEAELFGYKPGAFTGAHPRGKPGLFRQAHGGTVLLDEIHQLSPRIQSKLLRVLQEKEFTPVGAVEAEKADFRLIAATNQDLSALVQEGKFRGDLYFRINRVPIYIPPLRERKEDILPLIRHFNRTVARQYGREEKEISRDALDVLLSYHWPGNVRELANVLEQAFWTSRADRVERGDLPAYVDPERRIPSLSWTGGETLSRFLERMERETIRTVLREERGNRSSAARRLGIHRTLLYKKIKKFDIAYEIPGDG